MLKTVLIDDELNAMETLEWELVNLKENVQVVGKFTDPWKAIKYIEENEIDCVFLDIEMPVMDGFQFLEKLHKRDFSVIITTAFVKYALSAIKERAIDYLLKPIDIDDLRITIAKIKKIKEEKVYRDKLEDALQILNSSSMTNERKIGISVDGKIIFLLPSEIIYCESDGNYCSVFLTNNKKLFVTKKLKDIEMLLPPHLFYRIHHSYVINLEKVREYLKTDGYVVLDENKRIPVSRQKKSLFLDKI